MTLPALPPDQHKVADKLDSLFDLQAHNEIENRTLSSIRDLLLPKLMSGEIRIREAEAMVAAAA
jgi:type I restriction enzyme S subunit